MQAALFLQERRQPADLPKQHAVQARQQSQFAQQEYPCISQSGAAQWWFLQLGFAIEVHSQALSLRRRAVRLVLKSLGRVTTPSPELARLEVVPVGDLLTQPAAAQELPLAGFARPVRLAASRFSADRHRRQQRAIPPLPALAPKEKTGLLPEQAQVQPQAVHSLAPTHSVVGHSVAAKPMAAEQTGPTLVPHGWPASCPRGRAQ